MDLTHFCASMRPPGPVSRRAAVEAIYATAHWLLGQQRPLEAASVFRVMIHADPRDERGWLGLGECHERADQPRIAAEIFGAGGAVATNPVRLHVARARVLTEVGSCQDVDEALARAEQAAEASGDDELVQLVSSERRRRP